MIARFNVKGFPHLVFFRHHKGEGTPYEGGRTEREIVAWVAKKTVSPATLIVDEADLER